MYPLAIVITLPISESNSSAAWKRQNWNWVSFFGFVKFLAASSGRPINCLSSGGWNPSSNSRLDPTLRLCLGPSRGQWGTRQAQGDYRNRFIETIPSTWGFDLLIKKETHLHSGSHKNLILKNFWNLNQPALDSAAETLGRTVLTFLVTLPALIQEVQTLIRFGLPSINALTDCKFGYQRLLVVLWAWETLFPNEVFLPHISQDFDIFHSPQIQKGQST